MKSMMRVACGAGALLTAMAPGLSAAAKKDEAKDTTIVGVSAEASILLGYGLSVGTGFGDRFNVRGAYHFLSYDREIEGDADEADYDGELDLKSTALLLDWHPFRGTFRLTAGLMRNGNQINLTATPSDGTGDYEFGDCTYTSNDLVVKGVVDFKDTAPYLGLGWGGNMNAEPGFFATFDLGVMFSGAPSAKLKGRGSAQNADEAGQPECGTGGPQDVSGFQEFQDALRDAEGEANDELKQVELWPNIAFGLGWRF